MFFIWAAFFFLQALCPTITVIADEKRDLTDYKDINTAEKIRVTANKLISDSEAQWAEFVGNVKAVQGDNTIMADSIKIFYNGGLEKDKKTASGGGSIREIVAKGNVKIHFDNRVAVTHQAVYTTEKRVLVMSGDGSRITSGDDSISGEKISFYRDDGRVVVEGGSEKQVEAILYPGEKGIQ
ncbi:LptA/OstA family protein [Thermodesulfobacteriota bacterium]